MTNSKKIFIIALCDILAFAVCLCVFCWFHHVKKMWFADVPDIITPTDPPTSSSASNDIVSTDRNESDTDATEKDDTSDIGDVTDTETESEPTPEKHKWESLFAPEGTIIKTDSLYQSHNIYLTIEEVCREFSDYVAKYYVYDLYVRDINCIRTIYSESTHFIEDYIAADNSIAAISGDYWVSNAEISVKNGVTLNQESVGENDFCVLYYDGVMKTYKSSVLPAYKITDDVYQIWSFGPALLTDDGEAIDDFEYYSSYLSKAHPRSSIGYYEPGHYCFIVAEGRRHINYEDKRVHTQGITLADLSTVYEELGCVAAYNLDGGDSAYAYYNGKILRQDWDRANSDDEKPRKIYDIISIAEIE